MECAHQNNLDAFHIQHLEMTDVEFCCSSVCKKLTLDCLVKIVVGFVTMGLDVAGHLVFFCKLVLAVAKQRLYLGMSFLHLLSLQSLGRHVVFLVEFVIRKLKVGRQKPLQTGHSEQVAIQDYFLKH